MYHMISHVAVRHFAPFSRLQEPTWLEPQLRSFLWNSESSNTLRSIKMTLHTPAPMTSIEKVKSK